MIILPPNSTLSPKEELPVSEQIPAVNSTKYPIPTIFNIKVYKEDEIPLNETICFMTDRTSVRYPIIITKIKIPPVIVMTRAKSLRTDFTITVAITVMSAIARILKITSTLPHQK